MRLARNRDPCYKIPTVAGAGAYGQLNIGSDDQPPAPDTSAGQRELVLKWNAAEEAIKRAEVLSHLICLPAINELRYAGRRVLDAIGQVDQVTQKQFFDDAHRLCERAQIDALDAQVVYLLSTYKDTPPRRLSEQQLEEYRKLQSVLTELMRAQIRRREPKRDDDESINLLLPLISKATELHLSLLPDLMSARASELRTANLGETLRWTVAAAAAVAVSALGAAVVAALKSSGF